MNVHDRSETKKENSVPYLSSEETEPLTKKRGRRRVVEEVQEVTV